MLCYHLIFSDFRQSPKSASSWPGWAQRWSCCFTGIKWTQNHVSKWRWILILINKNADLITFQSCAGLRFETNFQQALEYGKIFIAKIGNFIKKQLDSTHHLNYYWLVIHWIVFDSSMLSIERLLHTHPPHPTPKKRSRVLYCASKIISIY